MKILVVEDTEDSRVLLVDLLGVQGYEVDSAVNGLDALEKIGISSPDIIISDILMPEMDGYELCQRLKKDPQLNKIPFIFYTATYTEDRDRNLALSMGATRFIVKPEEPVKLLRIIEEVIADNHKMDVETLSKAQDTLKAKHAEVVARKLTKKVNELEEQKEQLRIITDAMPALIAEIDEFGCYIYVNEAYEKYFHISRNEIVGKKVEKIVGEEEFEVIQPYMERALIGEEVIGEKYVPDSDGNTRYIKIHYIPHKNKEELNSGFFSFTYDLTEQKLAEEERLKILDQLRQSQKMDALGKLTGGIAHDYNNMLGIIKGYVELLDNNLPDDPKLKKYTRYIQRATERGTELTRKLLAFTRQKATETRVININSQLLELRHMLEKSLTVKVVLLYNLADDLWVTEIDVGDLDDVIINMSINALHAMETGGQLSFRTANQRISENDARLLQMEAGDYVQLSIADTGCGMDNETKQKIFDPFFSTKDELGTGLGLSQAYSFVKRSGGKIEVFSEPEQGTRFVLYFPRSHKDITQTRAIEYDSERNLRGSETLLVVDDEQPMVDLAYEIFIAQGYRVLTASDANKALAVLENEPVDLIVSDIIMPGMDGYQLASHVQKYYPHIKIQIVSGFESDRQKVMANETLRQQLLYKPYSSYDLLMRVRNLLDDGRVKVTKSCKKREDLLGVCRA